MNIPIKTNCLNYSQKEGMCAALTSNRCNPSQCRFFKTKAMLDEQVKRIRRYDESYVPYNGYTPGREGMS